MALTNVRWLAIFAAGCLAAVTLALRLGERAKEPDAARASAFDRQYRVAVLASDMADRLHLLELRDSLLSLEPAGEVAVQGRRWETRFDAPFDDAGRTRVEAALGAAMHVAPAPAGPRVPVVFAFLTDSGSRRTGAVPARPPVWKKVDHVLPSSDGMACLVIVRDAFVRANPGAMVDWIERDAWSIAGPCAFAHAFGAPGRAMRDWLRSGAATFVAAARWGAPSPAARSIIFRAEQYYWAAANEPTSLSCLAGSPDGCAIEIFRPGRASRRAGWGDVVMSRGPGWGTPLGSAEFTLLSDLVVRHGHEAVERIWRADDDVAAAFREAAGVELGAAVAGMMQEQLYYRRGPSVDLAGINGAVALVVLGALIAVSRSQRRQAT